MKEKVEFISLQNLDLIDAYKRYFYRFDAFLCNLGSKELRQNNKTSKSIEKQDKSKLKPDYDYPLAFAKIAKRYNIPFFGFVSAKGAHAKSNNFYHRVKGEIEFEMSKMHLLIQFNKLYDINTHSYKAHI